MFYFTITCNHGLSVRADLMVKITLSRLRFEFSAVSDAGFLAPSEIATACWTEVRTKAADGGVNNSLVVVVNERRRKDTGPGPQTAISLSFRPSQRTGLVHYLARACVPGGRRSAADTRDSAGRVITPTYVNFTYSCEWIFPRRWRHRASAGSP